MSEAGPGSERTNEIEAPNHLTITWHIVLDSDRTRTACTGAKWTPPRDDEHPNVPRELCAGCSRVRAASDTQEPPKGTFAPKSRMVPNGERDTQGTTPDPLTDEERKRYKQIRTHLANGPSGTGSNLGFLCTLVDRLCKENERQAERLEQAQKAWGGWYDIQGKRTEGWKDSALTADRVMHEWRTRCEAAEAERDRLREALEWIRDLPAISGRPITELLDEIRERARAALAEGAVPDGM